MKQIVLILFACVGTQVMTAGNPESDNKSATRLVYGKVVDKQTGEELAGAEIKLNGQTVFADLNGKFTFTTTAEVTEASVSFVSYGEEKIKIDPHSYTELLVELSSR
jgi:hypothetical protein